MRNVSVNRPDRNQAVGLLKKYVGDNLYKHCIATAAIMREVAKELGEDEELWEVIGILHDIDYDIVGGDMERHGVEGQRILLENGISNDIADIVGRHNHMLFGEYETPVEITLQAADSISGLVIACALVKGGRVTDVSLKTVKKKFKDKSFAAGCDRDRIRLIEKIMPLETFFEVAIRGVVSVRDELGLS